MCACWLLLIISYRLLIILESVFNARKEFDPLSTFISQLSNVCNHSHYKNERNKLFFEPFRSSWILCTFWKPFSISLISISFNSISKWNSIYAYAFWIKFFSQFWGETLESMRINTMQFFQWYSLIYWY